MAQKEAAARSAAEQPNFFQQDHQGGVEPNHEQSFSSEATTAVNRFASPNMQTNATTQWADQVYSDDEGYSSEEENGYRAHRRRMQYKINTKGTENLFKFDGDISMFKHWKETMEDHIAEDWHKWRVFLKEADFCPIPITTATLKSIKLKGFTAWGMAINLWTFISKFLGRKQYEKRKHDGRIS